MRDSRSLSREAEIELCERMRRGDLEARNQLIRAVLPFVFAVATKTRCGEADILERIAIANCCLVEVIDQYDPERGRLTSFVYWAVIHALRAESFQQRLIRLPDGTTKECRDSEEFRAARQKFHSI